jgi:hypothetical protein
MGIFGSSGRRSNPLVNLGIFVGFIGALISVVLWIYHFQPGTELLGKNYSAQIVAGADLADQLRLLAAAFGTMAVIAGIGAGMGGNGGGAAFSIVLGVVALSFPVLRALDVVKRVVPNPMR